LQLDLLLPETLSRSFTGLGLGASQIYYSKFPFAIGGFGGIDYTSVQGGTRRSSVTTFNPYIGYRYSKNLILNSSFNLTGGRDSVASLYDKQDTPASGSATSASSNLLEFAYVDLLYEDVNGIRVGHLLVPFGLLNLRQEPTSYSPVHRFGAEQRLIPVSWHENGILLFGKLGGALSDVTLQGGVIDSGRAADFKSATWIRGGRQLNADAKAENAALVLRAELEKNESTLGASFYYGEQGQGDPGIGNAAVFMSAVHGELNLGRIGLQAMWTQGSLGSTEKIASVTGEVLGKKVQGGFACLSFDLLPKQGPLSQMFGTSFKPPSAWRGLPLFLSYEFQDLNLQVPDGYAKNAALQNSAWTIGLNYKPHPQVVLKADYAFTHSGTGDSGKVFEAGLGFVF
jgi:hypothetical protein